MEHPRKLDVGNHDRNVVGMTYVYPVVSRRAGGVSVGINLNPNNACNWRCVYCQVPNLTRGAAPSIDLTKLETELRDFLGEALKGRFMQERVSVEVRRINDIAFSGNGEPTSAKGFDQIVNLVGDVMREFDLVGRIKLVLITNGSLMRRTQVQAGLRAMSALNGEVWFKLDRGTVEGIRQTNGTQTSMEQVYKNLAICASLCPTWIQTCMFGVDGRPPSNEEVREYLQALQEASARALDFKGVLLYGIARPSQQAQNLTALSRDWMETLAKKISALGVNVKLSL